MSRSRKHGLDKWALVEQLQAVVVSGTVLEPLAAAQAANVILETLPAAPGISRGLDVSRLMCPSCGALGEAFEEDVRACWTCRMTWR